MNSAVNSGNEHFDVLIVGAGISGIGSAYHLQQQHPNKRFCILDGMESFGGTWLTHKYPGIRSDSDLFTFGYRFKPWTGKPIASGEEILNYMNEVISDNHLDDHIRYNHNVLTANWCNQSQLWTITAFDKATQQNKRFTANFLWMCQGYYKHDKGYTPKWDGMDEFAGELVHPQNWPENLDYQGKKVVIIGSGATAATLAPNIAGQSKHVTLLQRSPTYFFPRKNENELVEQLRKLNIDESWIHEIARQQILQEQAGFIKLAQDYPGEVKKALIDGVKAHLEPDFDVEKHFTPQYNPWRQRIAVVPEGDIFAGIRSGKASIKTDEIECFNAQGIQLKSGEQLDADIIISATGFNLSVLGGIEFSVDKQAINFAEKVGYRGLMFTDVPNMAWVMGYFRASWTLRVDLIGDFICRLLKHMDDKQVKQVTMTLREEDKDMELLPWINTDEFNPGYMLRSLHLMPKRGNKPEWQHTQDYWSEKDVLPNVNLDDELFVYR
ncbi:NAD(P)/FAD-dependent oxidoreductase [Thalassotalea sp. HSM 43]|uniref:flavin-containing monooxygenase n=1 Tax=Thalassotalea sp. HSM 43 TaxID=2552945 RepID=UPI001080C20C|nr:NAD(P)/FAD-dependent oxidoreductase [Thalassotalea sp. HSM 43]QBY05875.1 NAD(P)/FAD-dependent oxidoreductase [Thalassotalea sp. HSM 43]